jgi:Uma2 family endonuclease
MPNTARRYTVDEVLAFPNDGNRYELVDGELLVTPAPSFKHQRVVTRLCARIEPYLERHPEIAVLNISPADITWDREKLVQPDVFVVPAGEGSQRSNGCNKTIWQMQSVLSNATHLGNGAVSK